MFTIDWSTQVLPSISWTQNICSYQNTFHLSFKQIPTGFHANVYFFLVKLYFGVIFMCFQSILPQLSNQLQLEVEANWKFFPQSDPPMSLSSFQRVLLVQGLRPDLLHSALSKFAMQALGKDIF